MINLTVALSVGFSSCNNDDDAPSLVGTTWVASERDGGWTFTVTITFTTETAGMFSNVETGPSGERYSETDTFTYTLNYPTVTITIPGEGVEVGVISGSTMNLGGMVFIRR